MAREQLLALAVDTDRLLAAGAAAANSSEKLRKHGQVLRDLGKKVAALQPVADAVGKVTDAPGKQAGPAFLDLVGMTRQIRASLAAVGVEGTMQPLRASGPWSTPMSVRDLQPLRDALTQSGDGREQTLKEAVERNCFRDLRLFPYLLDGLESSYAPIAELIADQALPAMGPAIVPELLEGLDLDGKAADARRLGVICKLDRRQGAALCRKALAEGGPPLRIKALECLPDVGDDGEAEKVGLELIADGSADVRAAAASALRRGVSDKALECLVTALADKSERVQENAYESLTETPHTRALTRLLELIDQNLQELDVKPAKTKAAPTGKGAKKSGKRTDPRPQIVRKICKLLDVVGQRKDARSAAAGQAVLPLTDHKDSDIREAALRALGGVGAAVPETLPRIIKALKEGKKGTLQVAIQALDRMKTEEREPAIAVVLEAIEERRSDDNFRRDALQLLPPHMGKHGKKILAAARAVLNGKDRWLQSVACQVLGEIGPPAREAIADLLALLAKGDSYWYSFSDAFKKIDPEGKEAVPGLTELLSHRKRDVRWQTVHCLHSYGPQARAAISELKRLIEDEKEEYIKNWAANALEAIEGH